MSAALFRRGGQLRCIHRELCRVVWRPQTAMYSSKSTDKIPPRITHFKKAKPQPPVDVNKLVEKLFSLTRSDAVPSAGKARRSKAASSSSVKPPSTSAATSSTPSPSIAALSAASSLKQAQNLPRNAAFSTAQSFSQPETPSLANQKTSEPHSQTPSDLPQASSVSIQSEETLHTNSGTKSASQRIETKADVASNAFPDATVEPVAQKTLEPAVESSIAPVEVLEIEASLTGGSGDSRVEVVLGESVVPEVFAEPSKETTVESGASVVEEIAEPSVDTKVDVQTQEVGEDLSHAEEKLSIDMTLESTVESSVTPEETLDIKGPVVEGPIDTTVEILSNDAPTNCPELVLVNKEELVMETVLETLEARTVLVEETPELSIDNTVNAQKMTEPLIKSQIESSEVEATISESQVEPAIDVQEVQARSLDSTIKATDTLEVEQSTESTIELPIEGSSTSMGAGDVAMVETTVEDKVAEQHNSADILLIVEKEKLIDTIVEALEKEVVVSDSAVVPREANGLSGENVVPNAQESASMPLENETEAAEEEVRDPEKMTLDSMTLHLVQNSVQSLQSDELLKTTSELDEKAAGILIDHYDAGSDTEEDGELLTEVLQKWDSLSEDLEGLEGESGMLMNELISSVPTAVSKSPAVSDPSKDSGASQEDSVMTLESITLAEVKEDVASLDAEVLEETSKSLEREAEEKVREEKMQVETKEEEEDVEIFADMMEPAALTLDSISEATDALEAETEIMIEAMFGSEQGPKQIAEAKIQEVRPEEETITPMVEDSKDKEGDVLEAMSVESVTLAEVEAFLGTLENETLSETTDYLEKEAQVLTIDGEKSEVDEVAKSLDVDVLSLPEVETLSEDLQTDALMEELLFTVPGPTKDTPDLKSVQEETKEDFDDAGMDGDLDPVQRLFVEKIREYNKMHRLNSGLLEAELDYQKYLSEEKVKLEKLYGGGDLENFPQFTFPEPKTDQDNK